MNRTIITFVVAVFIASCAPTSVVPEPEPIIISVLGTNDVHGELIPQPGRGGITTFSGYVAAVRDARADDGAVLLVDAGDMWQGTLESNLSEGAAVVAAYNALGYTAAALGNHEFDFGPVGEKAIPETDADDPQGALKQRLTEIEFPVLSANLIDTVTNEVVAWKNLQPSTIVERAGVKIGIIGVLTEYTIEATISANTKGLRIAPLAETIIEEARSLRSAGASLVIVLAHAGSGCTDFADPLDLSSCAMSGEIMRVANEIPFGLVDHIVAGHAHYGIAHVVNGIVITSSYSNTRAFDRVDFTFDRNSRNVIDRQIFPPQAICVNAPDEDGRCTYENDESRELAVYEGRPVVPMAEVVTIADRAREVAEQLKAEKVGVFVETDMTLHQQPETVLGNLFTDAVLQSVDADIAIHNVYGGIRAELPKGEVTFGSLYRVFPFDNRIAITELSGLEIRKIIANQVHQERRRAGFSGMRVFVSCEAGQMAIQMIKQDGNAIEDADRLRVVANDFLLLGGGGIMTPATPEGGFDIPNGTPLVRDVLVEWFRRRGGTMNADEFRDPENLRWNLPDPLPEACSFPAG
ncbi:MAG: 5'-nucleotidase C-terminal domain-containing protein [Gammaproteobacteria bacterium]|nr:5'-nucleotidase C-terminal domain-containing protein [Gammaproteobacteria bacterium]